MARRLNKTDFATLGVTDCGRCYGSLPTKVLREAGWPLDAVVKIQYAPRKGKGEPAFLIFTKLGPNAEGDSIITLTHKKHEHHSGFMYQGSYKFNKMELKGNLEVDKIGSAAGMLKLRCPHGFVKRGDKVEAPESKATPLETIHGKALALHWLSQEAELDRDTIQKLSGDIARLSKP